VTGERVYITLGNDAVRNDGLEGAVTRHALPG
jgi:hypothetical protein